MNYSDVYKILTYQIICCGLLFAAVVLFFFLHTERLIDEIKKHSVHPTFGNYEKLDAFGFACQPWDYCPPKKEKAEDEK